MESVTGEYLPWQMYPVARRFDMGWLSCGGDSQLSLPS